MITLGHRLRRINRLALGAAVSIVALIVVISSFTLGLLGLVDSSRVQARVLAENAAASLMFQDAKSAHDLLQSLRLSPDVQEAGLYTQDGQLFAVYQSDTRAVPSAPPSAAQDLLVRPGHLVLTHPVLLAVENPGRLTLTLGLGSLYRQTAWLMAAVLLAVLLGLAASGLLLRRLNDTVLKPLAGLNALTEQVSGHADYSVRASPSHITELNLLAQGFNTMLGQIQARDASLAAHREHLEDEVAGRTVELRQAVQAAEAASLAKSEFLATMSHEIRTPMNGVLGMNELLIDSALDAQQRVWADAVQASGRHLLGVINDILDFSKIESGQLTIEAIDFNLVDVVEDAVAMFALPAERKGLELAVQFIPNNVPLALHGDPLRLRQVLANLIGNAVKFTDEGEVAVRVRLLEHSGGSLTVQLSVEDTGIGIPDDAQARIFERFSQADGSTTRQFGGTGLGLAICRRLLGLMGGAVRVDSQPGRGSIFHIDLRLPAATAPMAAPMATESLAGVRVLVVDDNQTNRDILMQQLQGWRMQVSCAEGGAQALALMAQATAAGWPFQLALLDMHMPRMDGLQLAAEITARPPLAGVRRVMLSSTYANADQQARQQVGILRYLNKPLRRADLLQVITSVLRDDERDDQTESAARCTAPDWRATGLQGRVLLVEDNPVNQGVAKAMLTKLGLPMLLAQHGAEAVDMVRSQDFDLVLMDCQMPVMDGYEATRIIRGLAHGRGARLPIIALTANAMQGDEQKCLAAGMSAFLAKPYTLAMLRSVLARWLSEAPVTCVAPVALPAADGPSLNSPANRPVDNRRASAPGDHPAIDRAVMDTLRELDEFGGMGLAREIFTLFLDTAGPSLAQVEGAIATGNARALGQAAHALKSSAANVGAQVLSGCYRELEACARDGRIEQALALLGPARSEHQRARSQLQDILLEIA